MKVLQFFFASAAFVTVGYYTTYVGEQSAIAAVFAVLLGLLCLAFFRLDVRTAELVKIGEDHLAAWESDAVERGIEVDIVKAADSKSTRHTTSLAPRFGYSYGQVIKLVYIAFGLLALVGLVFAIVQMGELAGVVDEQVEPVPQAIDAAP